MFLRLFKEGFLYAVNSFLVNKLRTFLSLFGITIGIFSIISVFTVLDWMEKAIRDSIATLGDNVIYVQKFPWSFDPNLEWWDIIKWPVVSLKDYEALLRRSTKAEATCFSVTEAESIRYRKTQANNAYIWAATHEFDELRSFEIGTGRYFTPEESASGKNVAIIGYEVADRLFEGINPVGKEISIAGHKTNVIGVFKIEGNGGISDSGMDEMTLVPINFARNFINMGNNTLKILLSCIDEVELYRCGYEMGTENPVSRVFRAGRRPNKDSVRIYLQTLDSYANWFFCETKEMEGEEYIYVDNNHGSLWCRFLEGYFRGIFDKIELKAEILRRGDCFLISVK